MDDENAPPKTSIRDLLLEQAESHWDDDPEDDDPQASWVEDAIDNVEGEASETQSLPEPSEPEEPEPVHFAIPEPDQPPVLPVAPPASEEERQQQAPAQGARGAPSSPEVEKAFRLLRQQFPTEDEDEDPSQLRFGVVGLTRRRLLVGLVLLNLILAPAAIYRVRTLLTRKEASVAGPSPAARLLIIPAAPAVTTAPAAPPSPGATLGTAIRTGAPAAAPVELVRFTRFLPLPPPSAPSVTATTGPLALTTEPLEVSTGPGSGTLDRARPSTRAPGATTASVAEAAPWTTPTSAVVGATATTAPLPVFQSFGRGPATSSVEQAEPSPPPPPVFQSFPGVARRSAPGTGASTSEAVVVRSPGPKAPSHGRGPQRPRQERDLVGAPPRVRLREMLIRADSSADLDRRVRYLEGALAAGREMGLRGSLIQKRLVRDSRELGLAALQAGRPLKALYQLEVAARHAPGDATLHLYMGRCLEKLEALPEAIVAYRRAVELDPALGRAHMHLAVALLEGGDTAGAVLHAALAETHGESLAQPLRSVLTHHAVRSLERSLSRAERE